MSMTQDLDGFKLIKKIIKSNLDNKYNKVTTITIFKNKAIKYLNCDHNVVYYKRPNGIISLNAYNEQGKLVYQTNSTLLPETWYEYDEQGNEIHTRVSTGYESWSKYDQQGREIHFRDSNGREEQYDNNGNVIHFNSL